MPSKKIHELSVARLSADEMRLAIRKLSRCAKDLDVFEPEIDRIVLENDPRVSALSHKLDDVLLSIFGNNSAQYHKYQFPITCLSRAPWYDGRTINEVRDGIKEGLSSAKNELRLIIEGFQENIEDIEGGYAFEAHPASQQNHPGGTSGSAAVFHIQNVNGIVGNGTVNSGSMTNSSGLQLHEIEELRGMVASVRQVTAILPDTNQEREAIADKINEIDTELAGQNPSRGRLKTLLADIREIAIGAGGNIAAMGIAALAGKILGGM